MATGVVFPSLVIVAENSSYVTSAFTRPSGSGWPVVWVNVATIFINMSGIARSPAVMAPDAISWTMWNWTHWSG